MARYTLPAVLCVVLITSPSLADWPQWRGPERTGHVATGPLLNSLPSDGLRPVWKIVSIPGGNSGGWGSPVISEGRVFLYTHTKVKKGDPGEKKYPWLSPDKRTGMTDEEYKEYEIKRRAEDERRAKAYAFEQRLLCVDLKTGDIIWDKKSPGSYTRFVQSGTPCVADNKVFVLGPSRTAYCYDAGTGSELWQQKLPGDFRDEFFASSFVVEGDVALVACGPLYALDKRDGTVLWNGDENSDFSSHSSPVVSQSSLGPIAICNTSGGRTQAYLIRDGKKLWELRTGVGQSSPIIAGDLLLTYGSSRKNGLAAFRLSTESPTKSPEQVWQFRGASDSGSTPVVRGDSVFLQGEKRLAKVRLADGERIWQTTMKISTPKYTSLIGAGNQIFYAWEGILAFDANAERFTQLYDAEIDSESVLITGNDLREKLALDQLEATEGGLAKSESLWQKNAVRSGPLRCSTPAVSNGRLVVRLNEALVCYDLRD